VPITNIVLKPDIKQVEQFPLPTRNPRNFSLSRRVSPGSGSSTASHFSFLPSVHLVRGIRVANLVPVHLSATMLSRLYGQIVERVLNEWVHQPEVDTMILTLGDLELTISAVGGVIPWDLVASFASQFFVYSNRGLVSTYKMVRLFLKYPFSVEASV